MQPLRLLAIGNSLSENPLTYFTQLAASIGTGDLIIGHATLGGCTLARHWRLAEYTARNPEHKTYQFATGGPAGPGQSGRTVNLHEALMDQAWDYITINHASIPGPDRDSFEPWLGHLIGLIRKQVPGAKILLNQTWAYREDAPYLLEKGLTSNTMFERLRANYAFYAERYGCKIIPVGEGIQRVRNSPEHFFRYPDPRFDFFKAQPPALPCQDGSLSIGWYWNINETPDGNPQLVLDFNHLNPAGLLLAGLIWLESITGVDARQALFQPAEVPLELGDFYRQIAHTVCSEYLHPQAL